MGQVFVIRNQDGLYLTKQQEWHTGSEANLLFKNPHHDVALNTLIEVNAKDFTLRLEIIPVDTNDKGLPIVEVTVSDPVVTEEPADAPDDENSATAGENSDAGNTTAESAQCDDYDENEAGEAGSTDTAHPIGA